MNDQLNHIKRFVKEFQTEIVVGTLVAFSIKQGSVRKDIQKLAQASIDLSAASQGIMNGCLRMDREIGWLGADVKELFGHINVLYQRLGALEEAE